MAILLFISYLSFAVIKDNELIVHSPLALSGKHYSYSEVSEIYTGTTGGLPRDDNNLYYKIKFKDGTNINLISASINTESNEPYELVIEVLDKKFTSNGVDKNININFIGKFESRYSQSYVDNVKRILEVNK